ncbi:MAG: M20/M25/M40 family metallo-hydrolase [Planctomycetota bacterium]|nr:MAG: M20/M25/M40 family metallo-hydrolase [Planctomycetota bacterium]
MISLISLTSVLLNLSAPPIDVRAAARMPDGASLQAFHDLLASEPHVAGTPGDARTIERLAAEFAKIGAGLDGFDVRVEEFFPLLARPVRASLSIVGLDINTVDARRGVLTLGVTEPNLAIDPATAHPDLNIAWNAWSGSGVVEAGVIYVNYGRREDFAKLAELGIDPRGKLALARYGGNFRGYKAKFAQDAGCVGLIIFTDPADSGFTKGKTWPQGGGWSNAECVQRGSLLTLPYAGDPLTPFHEATKDAARIAMDSLDLPKIPVQPIGYGAAQQILMRMKGKQAPVEWRGGLACDYALEDANLRLHLEVEQVREVVRTANVIARLRGATLPDEEIIIGAHHDAWCFGAADPLAGTICMLECARNFAQLARNGQRPDRTLVFAAWGAEEYGIFGSTEFVERDSAALSARAVAYINLDMAAMGLNPGGAVSPTLRSAVARALVDAPDATREKSAADVWAKAPNNSLAMGDLGGGSDHVAFWCHAGVPSIALSSGGSQGSTYHSNYDTVAWYRATVGADYGAAKLVTGIVNAITATLAHRDESTVSPRALLDDCQSQISKLRELASTRVGLDATSIEKVSTAFAALQPLAQQAEARLLASPSASDKQRLHALVAVWTDPRGIPGRPWFRNLYAATDRYSGYGSSMWPLMREAIEDEDAAALASAASRYLAVAKSLEHALNELANPAH